ncbi:RHS repeat protein [bacterium]|nr:RHS repeat protein [bacterium]
MEDKVPGSWTVVRTIAGPSGSSVDAGPTTVDSFTMRVLAIKNIRAEKPKFDPKSEMNFTLIKGDVVALPMGWQPTGDIQAQIAISAFTNIDPLTNKPVPFISLPTGLMQFGTIGPNGEIADFESSWDGTVPGQDEPAEGAFRVEAAVIGVTAVAGTAKSMLRELVVNAIGCACKCDKTAAGGSKMSMAVPGMPDSPVGPSFNLNLDYCTASSNKEPGSMGFGWQGKSSCRVFEPAGQSGALVYKSESGNCLRWNLVGSDYVPAFADNYVEIVKNGSEPIYVVTFENQSVREFNADGRLVRELDRNGQAMTYNVDPTSGDLLAMTDATGQTIYFDYDGRTDGQPRYIRALDATTGREVELQYDANDRLEYLIQPGDGTTETTQFVYNAEGMLETIILPSGLRAVTYGYDFAERVVVELYTPTGATPEGFESVKEIYYDFDALILADAFGLSYAPDLVVVGTLVTDLTGISPGRLAFMVYDLIGNMVGRDELVFPGDSPDPPRFHTTVTEYNDPLNPRLVTRQIMPNGFTLTMTYNAHGDLASVNESYSDTTIEYIYTEDLDTPPVNPKWRHLLREVHRPTVTVNGTPVTYAPTVFTYDPDFGNLVEVKDAAGNSILMQVSDDGLVEEIRDRRGFTTVFTYNNTTRRLESVATPSGPSPAPSRTTEFTYDDYLNLETVTAPTLPAAEFTYDGQNRPKRNHQPSRSLQ